MLRYPRQLRHFTIKGQEDGSDPNLYGDGDRQLYINALMSQSSSLETLDFDIQFHLWEDPITFRDLSALRSLTVSPRMLVENIDCDWLEPDTSLAWARLLPPTLQNLTFHHADAKFSTLQIYEAIRSGYLHLNTLTCQIASKEPGDDTVFRSPDDLMSEISPDGVPYWQAFRKLGVGFSAVEVPHTETLPGYDSCPCTCWTYKHLLYQKPSW
ncbi:hypothetical protein N7528_006802 [Penicillium herquei]|nr:hypothetical protein N7528_006802 [Penicillium herquei]